MKLICVKSNNLFDILKKQCDTIAMGIKENRRQIVVVPTLDVINLEQQIMDNLNLEATFNVEVCTFNDILQKLNFGFNPMSSYEKVLLMQKVMFLNQDKMKVFKQASFSIGEMLVNLVTKLKQYKVSPSILRELISKVSKPLAIKLGDVILCWEAWENLSHDETDFLNDFVKNDNQSLMSFDFIFWGFDDFNLVQQDVLASLIKRANSVNIGALAAFDKQANADTFPNLIESAVLNLANLSKVEVDFEYVACSLPAFSEHMLTNVTAANMKTFELSSPNIRIFSATTINMEVDFLAQEIMQKVREGDRFRDCVVFCPTLSTYAPFLEQVFQNYHIPFQMKKKLSSSQSEVIKFLRSCFDCVEHDFSAADLVKLARNEITGLSLDEVATFCEVLTMFNITGENFINIRPPRFEDKRFDLFLTIREKFRFLLDFYLKVKSSDDLKAYVSAVRQLLSDVNLTLDSLVCKDELSKKSFIKFSRCLDSCEAIFLDDSLDFHSFYESLFSGVGDISLRSESMLDGIRIVDSTTGIRVANLFVIGAVDGALPSFKSDVEILDDSDLNQLCKFKINLPTVMQSNLLSKCEMVKNLGIATKTLSFSYPIHVGAENYEPATVVDDCLKCFKFENKNLPIMFLGSVLDDNLVFGGEEERLARLWQTKENMLLGFVSSLTSETKPSNSILSSVYSHLVKLGFGSTLISIVRILNREPCVKLLDAPKSVFFDKSKLRVTQIEKFFECPYAHFVSYGLSPYEKKSHKPTALDIGNIIHAVLEKFGRMIIKNQDVENYNMIVSKLFDSVLNSKDYNHLLYGDDNVFFFKELKNETIRACKVVLNQLKYGEYKLKFVEASFGNEDFASIPKVKTKLGELNIVGKVDRVDMWGNRLRIIDYKTSKASGKFSLSSFYLGKKIQLFYYMKVLADEKGYQAGGAYYMPVHREYLTEDKADNSNSKLDGVSLYTEANMFAQDNRVCFENPSSDLLKFDISISKENQANGSIQLKSNLNGADEEQFVALLNYAKLVLYGAVDDLVNGEIRPLHIKDVCKFCKFRYMCRKDCIVDVKERKSDFNVKLDNFKEVADEI